MKTVKVDFRNQTNNGLVSAPVRNTELYVGEVVKLEQFDSPDTVFGAVVVSLDNNMGVFQVAWDGKRK